MSKAWNHLRFLKFVVVIFFFTDGTTGTKREVSVRSGENLILRCDTGSNEPPAWSFPDLLNNSSRLEINLRNRTVEPDGHIEWESELIVRWSQIDDSGVYKCISKSNSQTSDGGTSLISSSEVGEDRAFTKFTVFIFDGENLITKTPRRVVATEGSRLVIPCRMTTKSARGIQLKRIPSSSKVPENTNYVPAVGFVVENASLSDRGMWQCLATNRDITTKRNLFVNVIRKPSLPQLALIGDVKLHAIPLKMVLVNEEIKLRCETEYKLGGRVKFKWSRTRDNEMMDRFERINNKAKTWYDSRKPPRKGFGIWWEEIKILRSSATDSANYNCTVIGSDKKYATVKIDVINKPHLGGPENYQFGGEVRKFGKINSLTAAKGYNADLLFKIKGFPAPEHLIFHNEEALDETLRHSPTLKTTLSEDGTSFLTKFALHFNKTQKYDGGLYTFMISNLAETLNVTFFMNVIDPSLPTLDQSENASDILTTVVGKDMKLECHASGAPRPVVQWYFGDEIIQNGSTYNLMRIVEKDEGNYTCVARNELGQSARSFWIRVKDPDKDYKIAFTVGSCVLLALLSYLGAMLYMKVRRVKEMDKKLKIAQRYLMPIIDPKAITMKEQSERLAYDPKQWEIPRDRLRLGKTIGRGAFGRVVLATAFDVEKSHSCTTVAVKMLKAGSRTTEYQALMSELRILIHIGPHLNIVNLFGACTTKDGPLMIIVEYCRHGNLSNYLRKMRDRYVVNVRKRRADADDGEVAERKRSTVDEGDATDIASVSEESAFVDCTEESRSQYKWSDCGKRRSTTSSLSSASNSVIGREEDEILLRTKPRLSSSCSVVSGRESVKNSHAQDEENELEDKSILTEADLLSYSLQIAKGMEFLSSKMCIHRDLAARNILVADYQIVKICDFGLARDVYHDPDYIRSGEGRLPLKWMALESIFDKVYSTKSDVWSFGVLLWEIFSLGGSPYPGIHMNEDFCKNLQRGVRMRKPQYSSDRIYSAMLATWENDPNKRPTFTRLAEELSDILQSECENEYLDMLKIFHKAEPNTTRGLNPGKQPAETFEELIPGSCNERQEAVMAVEYTDVDGKCAAMMNQNIRFDEITVEEAPRSSTSKRGSDCSNSGLVSNKNASASGVSIRTSSDATSGTSTSESPPSYATVVEVIR